MQNTLQTAYRESPHRKNLPFPCKGFPSLKITIAIDYNFSLARFHMKYPTIHDVYTGKNVITKGG
jgi:hypothetical protein